MTGKFELYKDKAGEFRFRLKSAAGATLLSSEGYAAKPSALNGIASVQKNAMEANRFETKESTSGKPYFVLKSGNGQVIGQSSMFAGGTECEQAVAAVQAAAPGAETDDQT